jgi:hypothetical protein
MTTGTTNAAIENGLRKMTVAAEEAVTMTTTGTDGAETTGTKTGTGTETTGGAAATGTVMMTVVTTGVAVMMTGTTRKKTIAEAIVIAAIDVETTRTLRTIATAEEVAGPRRGKRSWNRRSSNRRLR